MMITALPKDWCYRCNDTREGVIDAMCPAHLAEGNEFVRQSLERLIPKCLDCRSTITRTEVRKNQGYCNTCAPDHKRKIAQRANQGAKHVHPLEWLDAVPRLTSSRRDDIERWWRTHHDQLALLEADSSRVRARGTNYGIPAGEWMVLVAEQNGRCGICGEEPEGDVRQLVVDHDHIDGHVRGLLCHRCNVGLGWLRVDGPDAAKRLRAALSYIQRRAVATPKSA